MFTSIEVSNTGTVSFSYIFQNKELKAFEKFPEYCNGPFGYIWKTEQEGVYYMNVFEGQKGLLFAAPIDLSDKEQNEKLVIEMLPEIFSLLCTREVAEAVIPAISNLVEVEILFSQQTLLTA